MFECVLPISCGCKTGDEKQGASHGGKDIHIFFSWVLVVVVGWCAYLFDAFIKADLMEFAISEFFCIVVE